MIKTRLQTDLFDPGAELAALAGAQGVVGAGAADAGGVASFVGQVRGGGGVEALELEHYPGRTEAALDAIARAAAERWSLTAARVVHRVGRMGLGEPIVFVGAAAPHRRAALDATSYMIDVLKTQAPFWKKEIGADFSRWVEPGEEDAAAALRWLAGAAPAFADQSA